ISQAVHTAGTPPTGPVYVSVPLDDWQTEAGADVAHLTQRTVTSAGALTPGQLDDLTAMLDGATSPVLVLGAAVDAAGANEDAVILAERLQAPVWIAPSPSRCPFPTRHPLFRGALPAAIGAVTRLLAGHDVVLVAGAPVFRYHQYDPGQYLPEGARLVHLTDDPAEAARAPIGLSVVSDVGAALQALARSVRQADRPGPPARPLPGVPGGEQEAPLDPAVVLATVDEVTPENVVYVKESTSTTALVWDHLDLHRPGSYYFPA